jgi:hypothetical protein
LSIFIILLHYIDNQLVMLPLKSDSSHSCSPISSNCVIWQGPDIPCLELCNGDTITDIVYKLAVDYCVVKDSLDVKDLDISDLLTACGTNTPAPQEKSIVKILEIMIDKINCLSNQ